MKDRLTCEYCRNSYLSSQYTRVCNLVVLSGNYRPRVVMTGGRSKRCPLDIKSNKTNQNKVEYLISIKNIVHCK